MCFFEDTVDLLARVSAMTVTVHCIHGRPLSAFRRRSDGGLTRSEFKFYIRNEDKDGTSQSEGPGLTMGKAQTHGSRVLSRGQISSQRGLAMHIWECLALWVSSPDTNLVMAAT